MFGEQCGKKACRMGRQMIAGVIFGGWWAEIAVSDLAPDRKIHIQQKLFDKLTE